MDGLRDLGLDGHGLLRVTSPHFPLLPFHSLLLISQLQSPFESVTEPKSAKSLTIPVSFLTVSVKVAYFFCSHDMLILFSVLRGPPTLGATPAPFPFPAGHTGSILHILTDTG